MILDHNIMVLCLFVVEVRMKVLLIFILFSVVTTGVLSELLIDAARFVKDYLYIPYKDVPGEITPYSHAKQVFVLALIPPGRITLRNTFLVFPKVNKLTDITITIPWKKFAKDKGVNVPLYHAASNLMSVYISVIDYSQYTAHSGIPVEAHPDFSILSHIHYILKQFRGIYQGKSPAVVLMYSYYSPCNDCTDVLIQVKYYLPTPIFLGYSKKFENKKMHQTPDQNIWDLTKNGFIIINIPPAKLFSLEYLRQMLQ